jgi:uncharacterized protein YndB with AHSA1/START domain
MKSTRITHHINAPRAAVYRALLDPLAIPKWKGAGRNDLPCS